MRRSRRELSNEYFLAKFGLDTAENEPCQVCPTEQCKVPRETADGAAGALLDEDAVEADGEARREPMLGLS